MFGKAKIPKGAPPKAPAGFRGLLHAILLALGVAVFGLLTGVALTGMGSDGQKTCVGLCQRLAGGSERNPPIFCVRVVSGPGSKKTAVQPRMEADGHRYGGDANSANDRELKLLACVWPLLFPRLVSSKSGVNQSRIKSCVGLP